MKILPATLELPAAPLVRRHNPRSLRDLQHAENCLRWKFGFSCAFCLLHESDFSSTGLRGRSMMTVWKAGGSHRETAGKEDDFLEYRSMFLICCFCGQACSGGESSDWPTGQLLDPNEDNWSEQFEILDCRLQPRPGREKAHRTLEAFDLNDPRMVALRKARKELVADHLVFLKKGTTLLEELMSREDLDLEILQLKIELKDSLDSARRDLSAFRAIPIDAPSRCACKAELELPDRLAATLEEVDLGDMAS